MPSELLFLLFVGLIIAIRFGADRWDRQRITEHVEEQGGRVLDISWSPFGRGWFGEKNDRIYEVRYEDRAGDSHYAYCKTSLFSGVYFSEDKVARTPPRTGPSPRKRPPSTVPTVSKESARVAALEEENKRLREELKRERENR